MLSAWFEGTGPFHFEVTGALSGRIGKIPRAIAHSLVRHGGGAGGGLVLQGLVEDHYGLI